MTKEEIKELSPKDRLDEMTCHEFGINSQVCNNHIPIIYEGHLCPMCEVMNDIDARDKEIGQLIVDKEDWETQFTDMEEEKDELQTQFEAMELERDELKDQVDYFQEHCPEASI